MSDAPQGVTTHGGTAPTAPVEGHDPLPERTLGQGSLAAFFADSPLAASGVQLDRERDFGRAVSL